jgi:hypothetical protein
MNSLAYILHVGQGVLELIILVLDVVAIVGLLRGSDLTVHKVNDVLNDIFLIIIRAKEDPCHLKSLKPRSATSWRFVPPAR